MMSLQGLAVALLVPACALYASWRLAPASLKRRAARRLAGRRWPAPIAAALRRAAAGNEGCGCDGCDAPTAGSATKPPAAAPIQIHRRAR